MINTALQDITILCIKTSKGGTLIQNEIKIFSPEDKTIHIFQTLNGTKSLTKYLYFFKEKTYLEISYLALVCQGFPGNFSHLNKV